MPYDWRAMTRNKIDFAHAMKHLAEQYASAEVIRVVFDNLNTHKVESLYETFPPEQVCALAKKLEFHYTPKHVVAANVVERNLLTQPVKWKFTTKDARVKMHRFYNLADYWLSVFSLSLLPLYQSL